MFIDFFKTSKTLKPTLKMLRFDAFVLQSCCFCVTFNTKKKGATLSVTPLYPSRERELDKTFDNYPT